MNNSAVRRPRGLALKKPCHNCPFLKKGAIELAPGRLESIIDDLVADDNLNFQCHKTVHGKHGGEWTDGEGGREYQASGMESNCVGSIVYMFKIRRPSVSMRFAVAMGLVNLADYTALNDQIIDPPQDAAGD